MEIVIANGIEAGIVEKLNKIRRHATAPAPVSLDDPAQEAVAVELVGNRTLNWPSDVAAMPTELTRTALFSIVSDRNHEREMLDSVKLPSRGDVQIFYTGKQLCTGDETVWLACLRLGRGLKMGERINISKAELLRECNLQNTGQNWQTLKHRLDRLSQAHFLIDVKRNGKKYHIATGLMKWGTEENSGETYMRLDPDGARLFDNLAYQQWTNRIALSGDVSKRLLSYISGHQSGKSHWAKLEDLKKWFGFKGRMRDFKKTCLTSLLDMESAGIIEKGSSKVDEEIACWVRQT